MTAHRFFICTAMACAFAITSSAVAAEEGATGRGLPAITKGSPQESGHSARWQSVVRGLVATHRAGLESTPQGTMLSNMLQQQIYLCTLELSLLDELAPPAGKAELSSDYARELGARFDRAGDLAGRVTNASLNNLEALLSLNSLQGESETARVALLQLVIGFRKERGLVAR